MKTPRHRIADTIADRALKSTSTKTLARQTAAYLLDERRVGELDSLLRDIQSDWADDGHIEAIATSAFPLSPAIHKEIEREVRRLYPKAKSVLITEVHDASVIGGVRINLPNQQFDLSIQAKLDKFKQLTTAGKE